MVPPLGAASSKIDDSSAPLEERCEINSEIVSYNNGNTIETVSVTFTKKVTRDKNGNVIKETDTSQPRFQLTRSRLFSSLVSKKN